MNGTELASATAMGGAATFAAAAVRMASPLALAGLGESYSERGGVLNIGLEAIMLCGAFAAFMAARATGNPYIGILAGAAGGIAAAMLHALASITCRADQTIAGLALNFLASGATSYGFLIAFGKSTQLPECPTLPVIPVPFLSDIPFLGQALFSQSVLGYAAFAAAAFTWVVFNRTDWGMRLHAVGEQPKAADSAGVNVSGIRYAAAAANGALGGLGGACITLSTLGFFMENVTSGRGYIALVVVILGRRNPLGVLLAALMLGAADALQFRVQTLGIPIPSQVFIMFPYVATVAVLLFSIGKSRDPAALGKPFMREQR